MERLLHVGPRLVLPADDGDRTVAAVGVVLNVQVGLGLAEEGQELQVVPLPVAEGCTTLEILGQSRR